MKPFFMFTYVLSPGSSNSCIKYIFSCATGLYNSPKDAGACTCERSAFTVLTLRVIHYWFGVLKTVNGFGKAHIGNKMEITISYWGLYRAYYRDSFPLPYYQSAGIQLDSEDEKGPGVRNPHSPKPPKTNMESEHGTIQ